MEFTVLAIRNLLMHGRVHLEVGKLCQTKNNLFENFCHYFYNIPPWNNKFLGIVLYINTVTLSLLISILWGIQYSIHHVTFVTHVYCDCICIPIQFKQFFAMNFIKTRYWDIDLMNNSHNLCSLCQDFWYL